MAALYNCRKCNLSMSKSVDSLCNGCRREIKKEYKEGFTPVKFKK